MSIWYPEGDCDEDDLIHECDPCPRVENGRVSGFFFKKVSYTFADPTDVAEWQAAIASRDVIIIPDTRGTYDGGTPKYGPGYNRRPQRYLNSEYKMNYFDPNWDGNEDFYNSLQKSGAYTCGFVTSSKLRMFTESCTAYAKDPVEDDLQSEIVWNAEVSVIQQDKPAVYDIPETIFDECFEVL